ncbi:unnamed protein product [Closterium sp. Yama58-4]|nr:unnamed protein product [Closterium sp. Yama58-4]
MCARYEKALDSFLSTPTTATAATTAATQRSQQPGAALEPDLLFVFARKKQTPLDSGGTVDPKSRPKSRPPWLQWTLVAQLALPPLALTTALHEIRDTATDLAGYPASIHDARSTGGPAGMTFERSQKSSDSTGKPAAIHDAGSSDGAVVGEALGLPAAATRAAVLAAYEAATWRQQASILRHVARLQLSADWDVLGLSAASAGGYIVAGDGDNRGGDNSDGDSDEDEWGEQDQTEEDEEDEGESREEGEGEEKGEGRDSEVEEGEEEDEDLVWSEAEEQRALARDAEMLKQQQGGQGITSQELLCEGLTGGGDIDVLAGGGAAAVTAGAGAENDNGGSISDGGDELSVMEQTLVRKKEVAAGEVKAAVGPFDSVMLIGELTLLYAIENGEETF